MVYTHWETFARLPLTTGPLLIAGPATTTLPVIFLCNKIWRCHNQNFLYSRIFVNPNVTEGTSVKEGKTEYKYRVVTAVGLHGSYVEVYRGNILKNSH